MRRKDRERLLDQLINGVYGPAVLAGLLVWLSSRNLVLAVAVFLACVVSLVLCLRLWRARRDARLRMVSGHALTELSGEAFEEALLAHF